MWAGSPAKAGGTRRPGGAARALGVSSAVAIAAAVRASAHKNVHARRFGRPFKRKLSSSRSVGSRGRKGWVPLLLTATIPNGAAS